MLQALSALSESRLRVCAETPCQMRTRGSVGSASQGSYQQIVLAVSRFSRFSNSINRQQLKYQTNRPITCPMACAFACALACAIVWAIVWAIVCPMACVMACAKVSWIACDVRPPQQPLKHQTKAPHSIRNHGMRHGTCAQTPRMCLRDALARTFAKTHYSGPGRSLALVVVAEGRCR